eukprot:GFYU01044077.1.p1 GENE.GFYU01044077.1~~GFYU01044077.1.p1  ORF type:complete len:151 (-),score=33.50 GFYU01044077.1:40-492(-)
MVLFKCPCLNVSLHFTDAPEKCPADGSAVGDLSSKSNFQSFLTGTFGMGVKQEQPDLVFARSVESWTIYSCFNCGTDCYAAHENASTTDAVYINGALKEISDDADYTDNPNYSRAFRIILNAEDQKANSEVFLNIPMSDEGERRNGVSRP